MNELINDKAAYRTAPATTGLLNTSTAGAFENIIREVPLKASL